MLINSDLLLLLLTSQNPWSKNSEKILTWPVLQKKMQWGVMLLLGGGLALADLCKSTGKHSQISGLTPVSARR